MQAECLCLYAIHIRFDNLWHVAKGLPRRWHTDWRCPKRSWKKAKDGLDKDQPEALQGERRIDPATAAGAEIRDHQPDLESGSQEVLEANRCKMIGAVTRVKSIEGTTMTLGSSVTV